MKRTYDSVLNEVAPDETSYSYSHSAYPGSKAVVAYGISITDCPRNSTVNTVDGPAVLAHSIRQSSIRRSNASKYDYHLVAFVHPDARDCSSPLRQLGYDVRIRPTPIDVKQIQSPGYQRLVEERSCCGSREFVKLWAYTLTDFDFVVHFDTDVMVLQPLDQLFELMMASNATHYNDQLPISEKLPLMFKQKIPSRIDFFYTRDYLMRSSLTKDVRKYGIQGGFFVVRPDAQVFTELCDIILEGDYTSRNGWKGLKYGGAWGGAQIQGLLSYYYGHVRPTTAVELNRCIYNTMVDDDPLFRGSCRTAEKFCEDCRKTPLSEMKTVHLTTCYKPWQVRTI
jgi:hypothetical protein